MSWGQVPIGRGECAHSEPVKDKQGRLIYFNTAEACGTAA